MFNSISAQAQGYAEFFKSNNTCDSQDHNAIEGVILPTFDREGGFSF